MTRRIGFYHKSDLDGQCSGAILKSKFPDIELYGIDYGEKFPWELVKRIDEVYVVDYCLQPTELWKEPDPFSEMEKLVDKLDDYRAELVWIDHHISAIKNEEKYKVGEFHHRIDGIRNIGESACVLTWKYIYPDKKLPRFIDLLGKFDTWKNEDKEEWNNIIVPFEYGMLTYETDPAKDMAIWNIMIFMANRITEGFSIGSICAIGRNVLKYEVKQNAMHAKRNAYEVDFEGLKGIAINSDLHSSMVLDSVYSPAVHDIMIIYSQNKNLSWYVSFYSTKDNVDCSKIAAKYGGGGHRGAAGANVWQGLHGELPFTPLKKQGED